MLPRRTLIITGPGCIGKSPLDKLIVPEALRIEPFRLRTEGPRDCQDVFYAPPALWVEIEDLLSQQDARREILKPDEIFWYPGPQLLVFNARGTWQMLFLGRLSRSQACLLKIEIYAPVIPYLLNQPELSAILGEHIQILLLHPARESILRINHHRVIAGLIRTHCEKRGDTPASIHQRADLIADEFLAWKKLVADFRALEIRDWPFPEWKYRSDLPFGEGQAHQRQLLKAARRFLLNAGPGLVDFFLSEEQIGQIKGWIVHPANDEQ